MSGKYFHKNDCYLLDFMHDGILCCDCNNTLDKIKNADIKYTNKQIKIIVGITEEHIDQRIVNSLLLKMDLTLLNKLYILIYHV